MQSSNDLCFREFYVETNDILYIRDMSETQSVIINDIALKKKKKKQNPRARLKMHV